MLDHHIKFFLQYLVSERGLAANSVRAYASDLRHFAGYMEQNGKTLFASVNRDFLLDYLGECKERGLESATLARRLISLKIFFRFLKEEKIIPEDPSEWMDSPKLWHILPEYLQEQEVEAMLNVHNLRSGDPLEIRNRALLELFYASGLRVSELADLPLAALDFDTEMIRVVGKGSKTRFVPVGKIALKAIGHYLQHARPELAEKSPSTPQLFLSRTGKKLDRERLWAIVRDTAVAAGISKPVHPHTLRHSFASHLLAHGADLRVIQEMLGHACISTTEIYTHVDQNRLTELHRKFHPRS